MVDDIRQDNSLRKKTRREGEKRLLCFDTKITILIQQRLTLGISLSRDRSAAEGKQNHRFVIGLGAYGS